MEQHDLFGAIEPALPDGFRYAPDVVPDDLQEALLEMMPGLPFKAFDFHRFEGKRRTFRMAGNTTSIRSASEKAKIFRPFFCPCARLPVHLQVLIPAGWNKHW
jgi:hypothetical protein